MKVELKRLKESGHKLTPPRLAALDILATSKEHMSIDELHERIKDICPSAGLATTYRTLELLKELDLITSLDSPSGKKRYEIKAKDHSHLICQSCGGVTEIKSDFCANDRNKINQKYGFDATDCQVEYHGICAGCSK
ncbi:MAG: Fur family transcriptional regulator [Actinomycetota bacterium]|nr:Fur family transcriptional regulator [Actinomycetota bacterium]